MSKNSIRIWLVVSVLLAIGVAPFLAQGDQATRQQIERNRQTIANMTQSERDQLERNFAAYQKKTPQKLAALEGFHQAIEGNSKTGAGEYAKALDQYDQWLATIEPFQRDELKEISDPQKRIQRMTEIIREQKRRQASSLFQRMMSNHPFENVPTLESQEFLSLMERIESLESNRISDIQRSDLNRRQGLKRVLRLLQILKENTRYNSQPDRSVRWLVKDLAPTLRKIESQYATLIKNEEVRDYFAQEKIRGRDIPVILRVQAVIMKSFFQHVYEQQEPFSIPTQQQLESFFLSLPEEDQDDLLHLEAIEFYNELLARVDRSDENQGEDQVTPDDVRDVFDLHWRPHEGSRRRPSGKGPPGDREDPPGERDRRLGNGPEDRERERERNGFRGDREGPGDRPFRRDGGPPPRDERFERDENRPPE